jgi:hypothetical protein
MTKIMHRPKRLLLKHIFATGSLFAAVALVSGTACAQTPDLLDIQIAINEAASRSAILDYKNKRFNLEHVKMPNGNQPGVICGSIDSIGASLFKNDVTSYRASIYFRDGRLFASALAGMYMPINELLLNATCK